MLTWELTGDQLFIYAEATSLEHVGVWSIDFIFSEPFAWVETGIIEVTVVDPCLTVSPHFWFDPYTISDYTQG